MTEPSSQPSADVPSTSEPAPAPGHLSRPPVRARLRAAQIGAALWLAYLLLVPLRYYALPDHDPYDERFAWRMFSAVRVQRCTVAVEETLLGEPRRVNLQTVLPMPWIALVERNRPAVQRGLLRFLCERPTEPTRVEVRSECTEASGERAPPIRRALDCESRTLVEERLDEEGGAP